MLQQKQGPPDRGRPLHIFLNFSNYRTSNLDFCLAAQLSHFFHLLPLPVRNYRRFYLLGAKGPLDPLTVGGDQPDLFSMRTFFSLDEDTPGAIRLFQLVRNSGKTGASDDTAVDTATTTIGLPMPPWGFIFSTALWTSSCGNSLAPAGASHWGNHRRGIR